MWHEDQEHRALSRVRGDKGGAGEEGGGHVRKNMGPRAGLEKRAPAAGLQRGQASCRPEGHQLHLGFSTLGHGGRAEGQWIYATSKLKRVCKVESCSLPISIS